MTNVDATMKLTCMCVDWSTSRKSMVKHVFSLLGLSFALHVSARPFLGGPIPGHGRTCGKLRKGEEIQGRNERFGEGSI